MFERILFAAALAEDSPEALELVRGIAVQYGSEVVVFCVAETPEDLAALAKKEQVDLETYTAMQEKAGRFRGFTHAEKIRRKLNEAGVNARTSIATGHIAEGILEAARETGADLIVMGNPRRRPLTEFLTGSVTAEVLHKWTGPVLVVPRPERSEFAK